MSEPDPIEELAAAIEHAGTQTKFAAQTGFSQAYISSVVRRERPPSDKLLSILGLRRTVIRTEDGK